MWFTPRWKMIRFFASWFFRAKQMKVAFDLGFLAPSKFVRTAPISMRRGLRIFTFLGRSFKKACQCQWSHCNVKMFSVAQTWHSISKKFEKCYFVCCCCLCIWLFFSLDWQALFVPLFFMTKRFIHASVTEIVCYCITWSVASILGQKHFSLSLGKLL